VKGRSLIVGIWLGAIALWCVEMMGRSLFVDFGWGRSLLVILGWGDRFLWGDAWLLILVRCNRFVVGR
jgi:hypothetical protein